MTDREKDAIDNVRYIIEKSPLNNRTKIEFDIGSIMYQNIQTILNLIQTQQEEIKTQRDIIVRHIKKKIELEEKIEKKDKIIDEMAKTLKWALNVGLGFIPSIICTCKEDIRNCEDKICTDCIKQYFTKKVEKE